MNSTHTASHWWRDSAAAFGLRIMDRHVREEACRDSLTSSGNLDFQRAVEKANLPVGRQLKVIEIGCGVGRLTEAMAPHYFSVSGVDVCEDFIQQAKQNSQAPNTVYMTLGCENLEELAGSAFQVAFSYEVLHYLPENTLRAYFRRLSEIVDSSGCFVFQMNTKPLAQRTIWSRRLRRAMHFAGVRNWRGWPTNPNFFHFCYSPTSIKSWLLSAGFRQVEVVAPLSADTWFVAKPAAFPSKHAAPLHSH